MLNNFLRINGSTNVNIQRSRSEESLSTLVNSVNQRFYEPDELGNSPEGRLHDDDNSDITSLLTNASEETITNNIRIFDEPVSTYNIIREMPVVSYFLQQGVIVFSSSRSLDVYSNKNLSADELEKCHREGLGIPLLQTSSSMLSVFKKNSPFMVINKFATLTEKHEFCKVYFKMLSNNLTCYILIFNLKDGPKSLVLINNGIKPSVDFFWGNTKCRVSGVTGTTSTFGNGLIKIFIMNNSSTLLSDNMEVDQTGTSAKNIKIKIDKSNELYQAVINQDKIKVNHLINQSQPLINLPFGTFIDDGNIKIQNKLIKNGTIKIFDQQRNQFNENSLIIICILLVLREQEYRKNKGNNKPSYVNGD